MAPYASRIPQAFGRAGQIVNLAGGVVEVHRDPRDGAWATRTVHGAGAVIEPLGLPGATVDVGALLAFALG